jgi:CcmD family protein
LFVAVCSCCLLASPALAWQPPAGQAPAGQDQFVPVNELPPGDQLPAAPLLIGAYMFVWLAVFVYLWSIWRRIGRVESELQAFGRGARRGSAR